LKIDDSRQEQNTSFFWPHFLDPSIFHTPNRNECVSHYIALSFFLLPFPVQLPFMPLRRWILLCGRGGDWERGVDGYISASSLAFFFSFLFFLLSRSLEHGNKPQPDWKSGDEKRESEQQNTRITTLSTLLTRLTPFSFVEMRDTQRMIEAVWAG
jgi:hypothetical protein